MHPSGRPASDISVAGTRLADRLHHAHAMRELRRDPRRSSRHEWRCVRDRRRARRHWRKPIAMLQNNRPERRDSASSPQTRINKTAGCAFGMPAISVDPWPREVLNESGLLRRYTLLREWLRAGNRIARRPGSSWRGIWAPPGVFVENRAAKGNAIPAARVLPPGTVTQDCRGLAQEPPDTMMDDLY